MKKNVLINILGIIALTIIISFSLVYWGNKYKDEKYGFERHLLSNILNPLHELKIKEQLYRICGSTSSNLFFTGKDPREFIITDYSLHQYDTLKLITPLVYDMLSIDNVIVDSPNIYFYSDNYKSIISCRFFDSVLKITTLKTPIFTRSVQISQESAVLRAFDTSFKFQAFKKINRNSGEVIRQVQIIKDQHDIGFSTDGLLKYDSSTNRILYVQYYQNRFYCLDTNLNILYVGKTIDTTNINTINTRTFIKKKGGGNVMPSTPVRTVNINSLTANGHLLILSSIKADNEEIKAFEKNTVIDIYENKDGAYKGSFYIPNKEGKKAQQIAFFNGTLVVLYQNYICTYKLNISTATKKI